MNDNLITDVETQHAKNASNKFVSHVSKLTESGRQSIMTLTIEDLTLKK